MILFAACSSKQESDTHVQNGMIQLYAGMYSGVTRGSVAIQSEFFDTGEKIDVFMSANTATYPQPIVFTAGAGIDKYNDLSSPQIKAGDSYADYPPYWPADDGTPTDGVNIYAYYPSGKVLTLEYNKTFTVQSDQSSTANYKQSDLMVGTPASQGILRTSDRIPLTFTHMLSKIIVTLQADASFNADQATANNQLIGATVRLLNVYPTIAMTERKPASQTLGALTGTPTSITLGTISSDTEHTTSNDASTPWQLCAIIPPQSFTAGQKLIQIELSNHTSLYYALQANATEAESQCVSGKTNIYRITVNQTTISVAAEINSWTAGNTNTPIEVVM